MSNAFSLEESTRTTYNQEARLIYKDILNNYRPVSNLPNLSKKIERVDAA